jgi:hypothetical protein
MIKDLGLPVLANLAISVQTSLLGLLSDDHTEDFRHELESHHRKITSVDRRSIPEACRIPLKMYVALCNVLLKTLQRQPDHLHDSRADLPYPYLVTLLGRVTLVHAGLLDDKDGNIMFAYDCFGNDFDFAIGDGRVTLRSGTGV